MTSRLLALAGAALFALMAAIQLNDPDPLYWFTVYAGVALLCGAAVFGIRMPRASLLALGAVIAGMLIAAPGLVDYVRSGDWSSLGGAMRADQPWIEAAREFIGLAMAAVALGLLRRAR